MKIAIVQSELIWENGERNRTNFDASIKAIAQDIDLIVLPEMFSTGFTMNPKNVAETMDGETVKWMKMIAEKRQAAICGSVVIEESKKFRNRFLFVFPSGEIEYYDKRHLFTLTGENEVYAKGEVRKIVEYKGWRICPQICYDLRFPVFSRNTEDYDLLIYVANWPEARIQAWDVLLKARAIENMSYVIGVNRTGSDKNDYHYPGHSQIVDCYGTFVLEPSKEARVFVAELNKTNLYAAREKFQFLKDQDDFTVN